MNHWINQNLPSGTACGQVPGVGWTEMVTTVLADVTCPCCENQMYCLCGHRWGSTATQGSVRAAHAGPSCWPNAHSAVATPTGRRVLSAAR